MRRLDHARFGVLLPQKGHSWDCLLAGQRQPSVRPVHCPGAGFIATPGPADVSMPAVLLVAIAIWLPSPLAALAVCALPVLALLKGAQTLALA